MATDSSSLRAASQGGPADRLLAVVPSDTNDLPGGVCRCLLVGRAGELTVRDAYGNVAVLVSGDAQYHPVRAARVLATGTTAAAIVALY